MVWSATCLGKGQILKEFGRGERIRTSGPLLPKQVLYQAELHPVLMRTMDGKRGEVQQGLLVGRFGNRGQGLGRTSGLDFSPARRVRV